MRQQPAVVQLRAPARDGRAVRFAPEFRDEAAQQEMLGQAHARVWRHLEAAEFHQAERRLLIIIPVRSKVACKITISCEQAGTIDPGSDETGVLPTSVITSPG